MTIRDRQQRTLDIHTIFGETCYDSASERTPIVNVLAEITDDPVLRATITRLWISSVSTIVIGYRDSSYILARGQVPSIASRQISRCALISPSERIAL